jgi:phosphoribosylanthranilate isomerase
MRPILMLDNLRDLQDARYCAAVGVSMLGFSLEGPQSLEPKAVKEMVEWLSGPEAFLRFEMAEPDFINAQTENCLGTGVQIPGDYPLDQAKHIVFPILWRLDQHGGIHQLKAIAAQFPSATYLLEESNAELLDAALEMGLGGSVILSCNDPDAVWRRLQSKGLNLKGFLLAQFASDEEGLLDYDVCDAFMERFEELVPA